MKATLEMVNEAFGITDARITWDGSACVVSSSMSESLEPLCIASKMDDSDEAASNAALLEAIRIAPNRAPYIRALRAALREEVGAGGDVTGATLSMGDASTIEVEPGGDAGIARVRYSADTHRQVSYAATEEVIAFARAILRAEVGPSAEDVREAAVRADERAKVEAEVVAYLVASEVRHHDCAASLPLYSEDRYGALRSAHALKDVTHGIEAGRHRAEPADPPPVTIEQVMEAWGIDDLHLRPVRNFAGTVDVYCSSAAVDLRRWELYYAGWPVELTATCAGSFLGKGTGHAEALACALANAAKIGGSE